MRENDGGIVAVLALHIHEVAVGALNLALEFVHSLFSDGVNVDEIDFHFSSVPRVLNHANEY